MNTKQITYEDYSSLSGTSELSIEEVIDLFDKMHWQKDAFLYFEINEINTLQIMYLREDTFLLEITNDSEDMIFHQKYGTGQEALAIIKHFYETRDADTVPGFYLVPINEKTLDQVMLGK